MIQDENFLEDDDLLLSSPKLSLVRSEIDLNSIVQEGSSPSNSKRHDKGPSWDQYVVVSILGEGAYGKVYKVHKKDDQTTLLKRSIVNPKERMPPSTKLSN